ncbi:MAG: hypothetical protein ACSHWW_12430 [Nonlabens sp.]|uniref:hypothetical protein n=1 Tax=Nonlabens sp. TaxID=1888209 RepID=UPI003EF5427A
MILSKFQLKYILTALLFSASLFSAHGQQEPEEYLSANIGFGYAYPRTDIDISASGFYANAEYAYVSSKWFSFRPYLTYLNASFDEENSNPNLVAAGYEISANALSLGAKFRLTVPIPYVAPFMELGIGTSFGSFRKNNGFEVVEVNGLSYHIPVSIGLAIGKRHRTEIAFDYYIHSKPEQITGGAAIGITIPLELIKG